MANPWTREDARSTRFPVALGGLKAFVARNQLTSEEPDHGPPSASRELMARIRSATELTQQLYSDVRELERIEMASATAACMEPLQLQHRVHQVAALRDQLAAVLDMKTIVLQTLRKRAATESLDVEMEHQHAFVEVFCQIGKELPRFTSVVHSLENTDTLASHLDDNLQEHGHTVSSLKATVAMLQDAFDDIEKLRANYSRLRDAEGAS